MVTEAYSLRATSRIRWIETSRGLQKGRRRGTAFGLLPELDGLKPIVNKNAPDVLRCLRATSRIRWIETGSD